MMIFDECYNDAFKKIADIFDEFTDSLRVFSDIMDEMYRVDRKIKMRSFKVARYPVYQFNYIPPMLTFNKHLPYLRRAY